MPVPSTNTTNNNSSSGKSSLLYRREGGQPTTCGRVYWHPFLGYNQGEIKGQDQFFEATMQWLLELADLPVCNKRMRSDDPKPAECSCLSFLSGDKPKARAVTQYLWSYLQKSFDERKRIVVDMIHRQKELKPSPVLELRKEQHYHLPFLTDDIDIFHALSQHYICQHAIMTVLHVGNRAWRERVKMAKTGEIVPHQYGKALKGKPSGFRLKYADEVNQFFVDMKTLEAEPQIPDPSSPTKVIYELPSSYMYKLQVYSKFCWERGWKVGRNARGNRSVEERTDAEWTTSQQGRKPRCGWATFLRYWHDYHSDLKLRDQQNDGQDDNNGSTEAAAETGGAVCI